MVKHAKDKPLKYTSPLDHGLEPLEPTIELTPSNNIYGSGCCSCDKTWVIIQFMVLEIANLL